jgi:S1-C subfamily serine protease
MRRFCIALTLLAGGLAVGAPPVAPAPSEVDSRYVDDDAFYDAFFDQIEVLAKDKKTLAHKKLVAKRKPGAAGVTPAKPRDKALTPEEVYKVAEKSVFVVGSLYPEKDSFWEVGTYATAWVVAADGVLVTNWHVFEDLEDGEVFGASDRAGNVYPLTDFLGGDKTADVAVFRIDAKNLTPLPVATTHAEVGSWVGLISHPGDLFYVYTQGTVSRYSTLKNEHDRREKWMNITAEYASGSSGGPVLDKYGAVVGMAALTLSLDADEPPVVKNPARRKNMPAALKKPSRAQPPKKKDDKPKPPEKPEPKGSAQQMVVKMAVPGLVLLKWVGK